LLASTFAPTDNGELTENGELPFSNFWYFAHQVGWVYEDAAKAVPAPTARTIAAVKPATQNLIFARMRPSELESLARRAVARRSPLGAEIT
jgi:hypothetical protein